MKKIFAIALALVMVLSMASAFAYSTCATWTPVWNCPTDNTWCGQGKIEVVPYVKVNTACGWEYQVSDCAAAVRSGEVYFAIKLTVDAYPDAAWWSKAWIDFKSTGLSDLDWKYEDPAVRTGADNYDFSGLFNPDWDINWDGSYANDVEGASWDGIDPFADKEKVYYLTNAEDISAANNSWVDSADKDFDLAKSNVMFVANVKETVDCGKANDYNVCATLYSEYDGYSNAMPGGHFSPTFFKVGEYVIGFIAKNGQPFDKKGNFNGTFMVADITEEEYAAFVKAPAATGIECDNFIAYVVEDGKVKDVETAECSAEFAAKVNREFNMAACGLDTCITKKNIKANFGWDDAQEDCFGWSDKAMAVVDTECVVAIPKTGDASVLAWLF